MRKVLLLTIGMFALVFDAFAIAGMLPNIGATFKISASQTGQAVSVFTLTGTMDSCVKQGKHEKTRKNKKNQIE